MAGRHGWRVGSAALAVLLVLVAATAGPAQARTKSLSWMGAMVDGPMVERGYKLPGEWKRVHRAGFGFVRATFSWSAVEGYGPTPDDWSRTDELVTKATEGGLGILPVVVSNPGWAQLRPGVLGSQPTDPNMLATFMTKLIGRYGPNGTFWAAHPDLARRPIRTWQVWNEPNIDYYWSEPDWTTAYPRLLRVAHDAIKAADPGATVVAAGLTNASFDDIRALYANGIRGSFDAFAIHPYTRTPQGVVTIASRVRAIMDAAGDQHVPLWLTEMGWTSSPRKARITWNLPARKRAVATAKALRLLGNARKRLNIGRVILYTWASRGDYGSWPTWSGLRQYRKRRLHDTPTLRTVEAAIAALAKRTGS